MSQVASRGPLVVALGVLAIVGNLLWVGLVFGLMAWVIGGADLREMQAGRMDRSGAGMTKTGRALGMIGVLLWVGLLVFAVIALTAGKPFPMMPHQMFAPPTA